VCWGGVGVFGVGLLLLVLFSAPAHRIGVSRGKPVGWSFGAWVVARRGCGGGGGGWGVVGVWVG